MSATNLAGAGLICELKWESCSTSVMMVRVHPDPCLGLLTRDLWLRRLALHHEALALLIAWAALSPARSSASICFFIR